MPDDTIVIKAPAGTKARWVRQSQRAGMKLSDWVLLVVDEPPDPSRWLSRFAQREQGAMTALSESELREVMRKAYLAGEARA